MRTSVQTSLEQGNKKGAHLFEAITSTHTSAVLKMSLKQAAQGTSHVVKSTTSLDFFSNATKSTTTDSFTNAVDVRQFKRPQELKKKPRVMRSSVKPFHPFLNVTEAYKVSLVSRSSRASRPLTHQATLSNGQTRNSNDFNFISGRDALGFINMMRQDYFQLGQVSLQRPDFTLHSIDEKVAQVISQKLDNELSFDTLSDLVITPLVNSSSVQVTLEEKMKYIVHKYLNPKTVSTMFRLMEHYIVSIDNPQLAFRAFNIASNCATKHGVRYRNVFLQPLQDLHQILVTTYPTLSESPEHQVSFLSTLLFYKQTSQAHEIMLKMEQSEHCPDPTTFARYLRLSRKSNASLDNIEILTELRGLDDTIFTTLNKEVAQQLIPISRTFNEISSILDMLEMKYEPEQLQLIITSIESTVCETMRPFSCETPGLQGVPMDSIFPQKLGVLNRLAKYSPWSDETRLFVIEQGIKHGSFILARQMLDKVSLNKETVQSLKELTEGKEVKELLSESKPGQTVLSYQEFIRALEEKA